MSQAHETDAIETVAAWRRSTYEQALHPQIGTRRSPRSSDRVRIEGVAQPIAQKPVEPIDCRPFALGGWNVIADTLLREEPAAADPLGPEYTVQFPEAFLEGFMSLSLVTPNISRLATKARGLFSSLLRK